MKKYVVMVREVLEQEVEVWAEDENEAEKLAVDSYDREDAVSWGLEVSEPAFIEEEEA